VGRLGEPSLPLLIQSEIICKKGYNKKTDNKSKRWQPSEQENRKASRASDDDFVCFEYSAISEPQSLPVANRKRGQGLW